MSGGSPPSMRGVAMVPSLADLCSLRGRRAAVTGGARGIGLAILSRLAEAGASVAVGDRDASAATEAARVVARQHGVNAVAFELDVEDESSVERFAASAASALGGLDIWVNNAAIFPSSPAMNIAPAQWEQVIRLNLGGTFYGARAAARQMAGCATPHGVIVNIASVSGFRGRKGLAHYVASKHGVVGLTKVLAMEFGPEIRVLAVAPAKIATPGNAEQRERADPAGRASIDAREAAMQATLPLRRIGTADDVARAVFFCASDLASLMTGSTIFVDAGATSY